MKVSSYLLLSILLSVATAQVDLSGKTRYYTNGLTDAFHLVDLITPVSYTYTSYSDTSICISSACDTPSALVAYEISYANQGIYHACFCDNAVFDITYMADNIGRVPYPVRRNVISYTAASIGQGGGAYASAGKIAFFDQGENTEVFIHESAHVFDGSYSPGLSQSSVYLNGISTDACVPDDYAASNPVEDFAQLTVTWTYYVLTNTATPACLSNSISYLASVLSRESILATYGTAPTSTPTSTPTSGPTSAPPPSSCTVGVRQTLSNSWQSSGVTYSQYDVVFTNNGANAASITASLRDGEITQIWNLEQHKDGGYYLPSYQPTIAAGASYSWGYIVKGSSPITVALSAPSSCNPSTSTSAPVTSAPVTSAPVTSAPVTSAPVTSAPVTSAPATNPPSSSSCAFEIRQTLASTWTNNGITYSQFNVVYRNAGTTSAAAVAQVGGGVIDQYWNIQQNSAGGYFYLPSYQSTIAPNAEFSWGYISETSSALTIRLIC